MLFHRRVEAYSKAIERPTGLLNVTVLPKKLNINVLSLIVITSLTVMGNPWSIPEESTLPRMVQRSV